MIDWFTTVIKIHLTKIEIMVTEFKLVLIIEVIYSYLVITYNAIKILINKIFV